MHIQKSIPVAVLTALLGLSIACTKSSKPSDDVITQDVQTKVAADPDTKDSQVTVAAKEGKVTLTGKVKTPAAQKKVEQIAQEEPGVAAVDNQTAVEAEQAAQPAPPPPQPIVVPAGTTLTVRVGQALSSKTSQTGQTFLATLAQPVSTGGIAAIPAGSTVSGTVLTAKAKGKRTAATTGGGAAGGALIGGIAGGGKGAAIGALIGGGAGFIGGAATGNKQIEIPVESALSFQLSAPLTLPPPGQ